MRKSLLLSAMIFSLALPVAAQAADAPLTAEKGQMLHAADGSRVALVDRVGEDGSVQVIFYGHVVTVPATSLSQKDGELTTTYTKGQLTELK